MHDLCTHNLSAGIRCDVRNNDVLPLYMSFIQFTTTPTTLCVYNIETHPQTQLIYNLQNDRIKTNKRRDTHETQNTYAYAII